MHRQTLRVFVLGVTAAAAFAATAATASAHVQGVRAQPDYQVPIHFDVETRAWIPFGHVVDPLRLLAIPYASNLEGNCYDPPWYLKPITFVTSAYRGDGHAGYDGGFRVSSVVGFAWDGTAISSLSAAGSYGTTHRDLIYSRLPLTILNVCNIEAKTATSSTSGSGSGSTFDVGYSSKNPITPGFATPAIDSTVNGALAPDGTLTVSYREDEFPSHGIRITIDGTTAMTATVGDASCLGAGGVVGPIGAARIAWGLTHQDNTGTFTVGPSDSGRVISSPSPLCSMHLFGTLVSAASQHAATTAAAAAAGAAMIRVAPIINGVPGPSMSLGQAAAIGLVSATSTAQGTLVVASAAHPVRLTVSGSHVVLRTYDIHGTATPLPVAYGPYTGTLTLDANHAISVSAGGKPLRAAKAPHRAPRTRATVHGHGRRVTVTFHVRDRAGVAYTRVFIGKRSLRPRHGHVTVSRHQLSHLRFYSVDVFGNIERAHGLTRGQLRRAHALR